MTKIDDLIKQALKSQQKAVLLGLRSVKSKIILERTKAGGSTLNDEQALQSAALKEIKERQEANALYQDKKSEAVIENNLIIEALTNLVPKKLDLNEQNQLISDLIAKSKANTAADFGKVMALLKDYTSQIDMRLAAETIKQILSK